MLKILPASHVDHSLEQAHVDFILKRFGDRNGFFIETILLPDELPDLPCGLHGPVMGDAPVPDFECEMVVRGARKGPSRVCGRSPRPVRVMTVIAGPDGDEPCVLYTAFGGPQAPLEPWDGLTPEGREESVKFWAKHALSE